jgi:hypothetical protein
MEQWWNDTNGKTEVLGDKHYTGWVVDGWMVWSNGGMILTGETEVLGEKKNYSFSGV